VRHILLPLLEKRFNPGISEVLSKEAEVWRAEDEYLETLAERAFEDILRDRGEKRIVLDIGGLLRYHIAIRRRVARLAYREVTGDLPDFEATERLLRAAEEGGWVDLPGGVRAQRAGGVLALRRGEVPPFRYPLAVSGRTMVREAGLILEAELVGRPPPEVLKGDGCTAYIDWRAVKGNLWVRSRLPGDRIRPFGMCGTRKVKDVLIDGKVPRLLRDKVPLVVDEEGVLWVVGVCLSERARVGEETERVLRITARKVK